MRNESKPVSIWSQYVLGIVFPLVSVIRIKKTMLGVPIIIGSGLLAFISPIIGGLIGASELGVLIGTLIGLVLSIVIPLFFIVKWSKLWNKKAQSLSESNSENC